MGWKYNPPDDMGGILLSMADEMGLRCGWFGAVIGAQPKDIYKVRIMGFKANCEDMANFEHNADEREGLLQVCAVAGQNMDAQCNQANFEGGICTEFYTLNPSHINMEIEVPADCLEPDH